MLLRTKTSHVQAGSRRKKNQELRFPPRPVRRLSRSAQRRQTTKRLLSELTLNDDGRPTVLYKLSRSSLVVKLLVANETSRVRLSSVAPFNLYKA